MDFETILTSRGYTKEYEETEKGCEFAIFNPHPQPGSIDNEVGVEVSPWPNPTKWGYYARGAVDMDDVPRAKGTDSLETFLNYLDEDDTLGDPRSRKTSKPIDNSLKLQLVSADWKDTEGLFNSIKDALFELSIPFCIPQRFDGGDTYCLLIGSREFSEQEMNKEMGWDQEDGPCEEEPEEDSKRV